MKGIFFKKISIAVKNNNATLRKIVRLNSKVINWGIFTGLSIVWGSSFILMMKGLESLTAYQVASLRIVFSGMVLMPIAIRNFNKVPSQKLWLIFLSGVQGSLLPAYLFCLAETKIDSSLAGSLNALTPVFVLIMGLLFFKTIVPYNKIWGIAISFTGSILLFFAQPLNNNIGTNALYTLLVIAATIMYGINVNMVGKFLKGIPSLHIASIALTLCAIPALAVLIFTGYFNLPLMSTAILRATGYSFILGVFGTAIASVFFYVLMKRAGMVFASTVTYAIPAVAIVWAILEMHKQIIFNSNLPLVQIINTIFFAWWKQFLCLLVILFGVYLANKTVMKNS